MPRCRIPVKRVRGERVKDIAQLPPYAAGWEERNSLLLEKVSIAFVWMPAFAAARKRFSGQKPRPTLERRNDEKRYHIQRPDCHQRFGYYQE